MFHFWSKFPITVLFIMVGGILFFYLRNLHREKLELIKRGESLVHQDALQQMKFNNLARGIIAISLSIGVFCGHLLETYSDLQPMVTYTSMILLFFGIGSMIFYIQVKNK